MSDAFQQLPAFSRRNLEFGKVSAEEEKQILPHYFIQTAEYARVKACEDWLVLGQKGSGKTAIAIQLLAERAQKTLYVDISPDEMNWQHIRKFDDCGISASQAKKNAWLAIFLRNISERIEQFVGKPYPLEAVAAEMERCGISKAARMQLQELGIRIFQVSAKFGKGDAPKNIEFGSVISAVKMSLKLLDEALRADDVKVRLLVDKLDEHWRGDPQENFALEGLILAARFLAEETANIRVQVFLRTDIWNRLEFHDKDKVMDSAVFIRWDETAFEALLAERIRYSTRQFFQGVEYVVPGSDPDVIKWAFVSEVEGVQGGRAGKRDFMKFISSLVYRRPRDLIQFAQLAVKRRGHDEAPIGSEHILGAAEDYSDIRYQNIEKAESTITAPHLGELLQWFRDSGTNVKIRYPRLLAKIGEAGGKFKDYLNRLGKDDPGALDILHQVYVRFLIYYGVIGVQRKDGSGVVDYYYDDHRILNNEFKSDTTFVFHPSLHKSMRLKQRGD